MGIAEALRTRGKLSSVQHEQLLAARDRLTRVYGLRLDTKRLDDDQRLRLIDLVDAASPEGQIGYGGVNLGQLGKRERREPDSLVEKAAGIEPGSLAKQREEEQARMKLAEIARRALMPRRPLFEEPGSVRVPAVAFAHLDRRQPVLDLPELGVLMFCLLQIENAKSLSPGGRIERDDTGEPVVVINANIGLGTKYDVDDRVTGWQVDLQHLHANGWLVVARQGQEIRVRRGALLLPGGKPRAERKETK